MGVDLVQPVAMRSVVFCVVCSLSMCVSAVSGCQAMCAYESMGLMFCLYVCLISSLEWLKDVIVSAGKTFRWVLALVLILSVCCPNVIPLGVRGRPRFCRRTIQRQLRAKESMK